MNEDKILQEKRLIRDDETERIPWREFIRNQFRKVTAFVIMLIILFIIIELSREITPDPSEINPDGVIGFETSSHIYLIILSSVLFVAVLGIFTKVVLLDHREEFGITYWKQPRVFVTFMLTTSFISLVYILLDISLINVYLMTFPTWLLWSTQGIFSGVEAIIPNEIDRLSYSAIRGYIFIGFLLFLFIFPLSMFVSIFTRLGRSTIKKRREKKLKLPMPRLIFALIASIVLSGGSFFVYSSITDEVIAAVFLFITLGFLTAAAFILVLIIINFIRFTVFLSYSNFLLIFPFIFMFYLLPAGLWGIWDLVVIITNGGIDNTVYSILPNLSPRIDPTTTNITELGNIELFSFYLQTVSLNLRAVLRIIQLDFIIVVGLSALVIGFAEGYSILAIFRSIAQGVSIAKSGRVASRSAPKIIVITSRLFYLFAWLSFLWDNLLVLFRSISNAFSITLPLIELPQILNYVVDFSINLGDLSSYLLVLTILAVPFYFIITSSFKFLSVSLVLERVQDDKQLYYLLISSAFILIVTNIFADIASLPAFIGDHKAYLPLAGAATEDLLPFVAKMFELLESLAFYGGVIASIILTIKKFLTDKADEQQTGEEITIEEESTTSNQSSEQIEPSNVTLDGGEETNDEGISDNVSNSEDTEFQ